MMLKLKKALIILLCAAMVLPFAACGENTETPETGAATGNGTVVTEPPETEEQPFVEKQDFDAEFQAVYCSETFAPGYFIIDEDERRPGNDLDDKLYERILAIKDYLGVDVYAENGGNHQVYSDNFKNTVNSGDDAYQLMMTHVHIDLANMVTGNYFRDYNEFDNINLEGDYWNRALMDDLAIDGKLYCGYNDFCLALCYMVGFNKDMVAEYPNDIGNLYEQVNNGTWTLDKLIAYSSLVSRDANGDGKMDKEDIYGLSTLAWVNLICFQVASDIRIVDKDAEGIPYVAPMVDNADKIVELDEKIHALCNSDSTFYHLPAGLGLGNSEALPLRTGRVMFELIHNHELITTKEDDVKVGVLPYPKWDEAQEDYYTMNWNGVLGIPTTVQNEEMVGAVIEMLAYYSEPVTTAFYETLLGAKVSDAPEDVEMLRIIWANQVTDVGLAYSDCSDAMNNLLYAICRHVAVPGTPAYATVYKQNQRTAQNMIRKMFSGDRR